VTDDVQGYLDSLPADRREVVESVRDLVNAHLPDGYQETLAWGMITWSVPLERYPDTYNGQPLGYLALAAQRRHFSLYLMGLYLDSDEARQFRERWEATGRRLDMGKSCLRFKNLDGLDRGILAEVVASMPVDALLAQYERVRPAR
jgi:hypothetical protein